MMPDVSPNLLTKSADNKITRFRNCKLLREHQFIIDDLWVRNGKILNPEKVFFDEHRSPDVNIDCKGNLIAPGFIDVQINGAFGIDFSVMSDNMSDGIERVAKGLLAHGVTSFCPTVVTSRSDTYAKILPKFRKTEGSANGAGILGLHLEGPFINKEKKGAHAVECIADMSRGLADVQAVYGSLENVVIVTLAPELPGALDVVRELTAHGIVVSLGHSMADLSEGEEAVRAGAGFITHLFNAMLPFHHRDPHLVGLLASTNVPRHQTVFYGMIADGVHTHPAALRIAHRTHPAGLVLVSDAAPAMGLSPGKYHLGSQDIEVLKDKAVLTGTDTLAGSIATMSECVQHFYTATESSQVEALEAASLHPAQLLHISDRKGTLEYGSDADFVLLDEQLTVLSTHIAGEKVWELGK